MLNTISRIIHYTGHNTDFLKLCVLIVRYIGLNPSRDWFIWITVNVQITAMMDWFTAMWRVIDGSHMCLCGPWLEWDTIRRDICHILWWDIFKVRSPRIQSIIYCVTIQELYFYFRTLWTCVRTPTYARHCRNVAENRLNTARQCRYRQGYVGSIC